MTTVPPQRRSRRPRWRPQFTLGWLLGAIVVANVYFAYFLHQPATWDYVMLHVATDSVTVGNRKTSWNQLAARLKDHVTRINRAGTNTASATVRFTVDGNAAYSDFLRAVKACREAGLQRLQIRPSGKTDWFHLMSAQEYTWTEMPPITIYLAADSTGTLVRVHTLAYTINVPQKRDAREAVLSGFRGFIIEYVGTVIGPGPPRTPDYPYYFELNCHDHMRFEHVAAVLRAMTQEPKSGSGPRVPLMRRFVLAGDVKDLIEELDPAPSGLLDLGPQIPSDQLLYWPPDPIPPIDPITPAEAADPSHGDGK